MLTLVSQRSLAENTKKHKILKKILINWTYSKLKQKLKIKKQNTFIENICRAYT